MTGLSADSGGPVVDRDMRGLGSLRQTFRRRKVRLEFRGSGTAKKRKKWNLRGTASSRSFPSRNSHFAPGCLPLHTYRIYGVLRYTTQNACCPDTCWYLIHGNHSQDSYYWIARLHVAGGAENLGSRMVEGPPTPRKVVDASHIPKEMRVTGSVASIYESHT